MQKNNVEDRCKQDPEIMPKASSQGEFGTCKIFGAFRAFLNSKSFSGLWRLASGDVTCLSLIPLYLISKLGTHLPTPQSFFPY